MYIYIYIYIYIYTHQKTAMNCQYAFLHYLGNFTFDEVQQFLIVQHHREINV